jgi:kynureninase
MGQANMFNFGLDYERGSGLAHFLTGTPPVLSTLAIEPGIDLLLEAGIDRVRAKSLQQTTFMIDLWAQELAGLGFTLNTPRDPAVRGSHISLGHPDGWGIDQALINELGVLPDFRAPHNIRFGITPLYTSFEDIYEAVMRTKRVVTEKLYLHYRQENLKVT